MKTLGLPRIWCAVCNKEVDEVILLRSECEDSTTIRVKCHGEIDNCKLDGSLIITALNPDDLTRGVAFQNNKLPEPQKLLEAK